MSEINSGRCFICGWPALLYKVLQKRSGKIVNVCIGCREDIKRKKNANL